MIDAAQCLARSKSLYELARICSTEKLRIETLDIAAYCGFGAPMGGHSA
jgi:hypothetical protein